MILTGFRTLVLGILFLLVSVSALAAKKATIIGDFVEVYSSPNFDSEVFDEVYKGETYQISDKNIGPFYKIKLKNGKFGYVVDYQLNIEGKGPLQPKDLDEVEFQEQRKLLAEMKKKGEIKDPEEEKVFGRNMAGPFVMIINYHEKTMGGDQVDDILGYGYKAVDLIAWSFMISPTLPKYYSKIPGSSGNGTNLWGDLGFSHTMAQIGASEIRFSGNLFTHFSLLKVETPTQKYDLQDITAGLNIELAWDYKFKSVATDLAVKYYFDKTSYAGLSFGVMF